MKFALSYHYSAGRRRGALRSRAGQQLIELIFAVAITGFLAAVMSTSLSQTLATSVAAENRMTAAHIAQELLDRVRDCPFSDLPPFDLGAYNIAYPVQVYSDDGVTPASTYLFAQSPLLMDVNPANYNWSEGSLANRLRGTSPNGYATATATFTQASTSTSVGVSINIGWQEGTASRSLVLSSLVSQSGMHN